MSLTCITTAGADNLLQRTSTLDELRPRRQTHWLGCGLRAERQYGQGNNLKQAERKEKNKTATDAPSEASSSPTHAVVAHLRRSCKGLGLGMQLDSCDAAHLAL